MIDRIPFRRACLAALLFLGVGLSAASTWPNLMNYQGQLTDASGNAVADGGYNVTFRIYTVSSGGSSVWNETQTVTASKGLFNAIVGSTTGPGLSTLTPAQLNGDLWLGIQVNSDPEMTPRQQLLGPINANNAAFVGGLQPGSGANNLVVLDGTGKIPAGLIQGGSIQFPLAMAGNAAYGLSVVNSNGASSAVGLSVVASSGIQSFATDPNGSAVAGYSGSSTGYAISGTNTSSTGVGVLGQGFIGVQGIVNQSSGSAFGVQGIVSGTSSSNAIAISGLNYVNGGTAVSGRDLGSVGGMGVRGSSTGAQGAIGVYGVVSGTGGAVPAVSVEGYTSQSDSIAVVGQQANSSGAAYPYAGVRGYTAGLGLGIGVLGEGNQGVYGNSGGVCGVCAVNQNTFSGSGLSATGPLTAVLATSTGTSNPGIGVNASVASPVNGSAAGQFNANGTSGQTYGLNVSNGSPSGTGILSTGGHIGVQVQSLAGGTNFNSDGTNSPAFGFAHTDNGNPTGAVGVYAAYPNCPSCFGGIFINTAAQNGGTGAALSVQGRLNISDPNQSIFNRPAGTFVAGSGLTVFTFNNPYITATSLIFLTVATPGTLAVASVSGIVNGSATITFSTALTQNTTYQYLIIGQ